LPIFTAASYFVCASLAAFWAALSSVAAFLAMSSAGFNAEAASCEASFVASVLAAVATFAASAAFLLAIWKAFFPSLEAWTA